ncbi:MAG: secondary thiamine-phosphate synthase enzyme YjbQ [Sphaerochaetaceae bacterium]|nr:secondary thiamine-phosphate synthase enzyme YjbQ [Sphaerochaetaceae bacterium]
MFVDQIELETKKYVDFYIITKEIEKIVSKSQIKNGVVTVITKHTTTAITVNEALECLQSDIEIFLSNLVREDSSYSHARMLRNYGSTAGNPTGHIKSLLIGNHCHFILINGQIIKGDAQDVFFCEFDGPSKRTVMVSIEEK